MQEFISFEAARAFVLADAAPGPMEHVALDAVLGRTLAEPILGRDLVPPFANSGMDGYAVRAADLAALPATLQIGEDIPAGHAPRQVVAAGTCARIMTGAPMPEGADAVVPVEWTREAEGRVTIERAPSPGQFVRAAGGDVRPGDRLVEAGTRVTPPVVGLLATVGVDRVAVRRAPRVAVVTTGDELVPPGAAPGPGQIRDANGPALRAQVVDAGGAPLPPLQAPDDAAVVREVIEATRAADVLVFSGGVSVGRYDLVRAALEAAGVAWRFWRVRQRPGKPLAFGLLDGKPVFGLPGNPVSSAVCFEVYVRPLLARLLGRRERALETARLDVAVDKPAGLHHFVRGVAWTDEEGVRRVRDTGPQASNLYTSVVRADVLIHLPEALEAPGAGTLVRVQPLPWCGA